MFTGFSKETGEFLWELAFHNERPWFLEHKEQFERTLNEPFRALAREVYDELRRLAPEEEWRVHVSRIYRDARRLYGRGPYKDHLWMTFTPASATAEGPAFWFEIGASDYSYGLGFWGPTSAAMEAFHRAVAANPARFESRVSEVSGMRGFALHGESFRRPKADLGEIINPWYNRKYFDYGLRRDHDELLYSEKLPKKMARDFVRLLPLCRFLTEAVNAAT